MFKFNKAILSYPATRMRQELARESARNTTEMPPLAEKNAEGRGGAILWLLLSLFVLLLDQLTKYFAAHFLTLYQPVPITSFFNLILAHNTGAAFSLFDNREYSVLFLSLFAIVISLFILIWLLRLPNNNAYTRLSFALALILGGGIWKFNRQSFIRLCYRFYRSVLAHLVLASF